MSMCTPCLNDGRTDAGQHEIGQCSEQGCWLPRLARPPSGLAPPGAFPVGPSSNAQASLLSPMHSDSIQSTYTCRTAHLLLPLISQQRALIQLLDVEAQLRRSGRRQEHEFEWSAASAQNH